MQAPVLETARLSLRPCEAVDIEPMAAMYSDPDVTAHTSLGRLDRVQTQAVLDGYRAFTAERGFGMYAVLDRISGAYLGEAGTVIAPVDDRPVALRYALVRSAWGRGYATEASEAIIDDAFGRLELETLAAGVMALNGASIRVMEKLGFEQRYSRDVHGHTFGMYFLDRSRWRDRQGRSVTS